MTKTFIYDVKGFEYRDNEAFGKAWKEAKAKATELHCGIFRTVKKDDDERYEFYTKYGAFLNTRFYDESKVAVF
jgi:hypothetical protein